MEPSFVKGEIKTPSSKSMTQRAIAAAMLSEGESILTNPSFCDDSLAAINIATALGANVITEVDELKITGRGKIRDTNLNCGESGLSCRMFSPVAALFAEEITMSGKGSIMNRPMSMIVEALNQLGVKCISSNGFLPLKIKGPLTGGSIEIDGSVSSQLLTGLLMALPLAEKDSVIKVNNLKSKPYIDLTVEVLNDFGVTVRNTDYSLFQIPGNQKFSAHRYEVEGDWSSGAFLLVAGAINGNLSIHGLRGNSSQSDRAVISALKIAGAKMTISPDKIDISKSALEPFEFDATESPDLFPPLVALASYCNGRSIIKGVSRLGYKESNRAESLKEEFGKINIKIETDEDLMFITGGRVTGGRVHSHNDHRIAMALAVAALGATDKVIIGQSGCITKSYPGFFDNLRAVEAVIHE